MVQSVVKYHHSILSYHAVWTSVIHTFGCVTARIASRASSRSWVEKGPRLPPPDTELRRSPRDIVAGSKCLLSQARVEYLEKWIWQICSYKSCLNCRYEWDNRGKLWTQLMQRCEKKPNIGIFFMLRKTNCRPLPYTASLTNPVQSRLLNIGLRYFFGEGGIFMDQDKTWRTGDEPP